MPKNARNFWVEAFIDGRSATLAGGPQGKRGEMVLHVYQRDDGQVREVLTLRGVADSTGELHLYAEGDLFARPTISSPTGCRLDTVR